MPGRSAISSRNTVLEKGRKRKKKEREKDEKGI